MTTSCDFRPRSCPVPPKQVSRSWQMLTHIRAKFPLSWLRFQLTRTTEGCPRSSPGFPRPRLSFPPDHQTIHDPSRRGVLNTFAMSPMSVGRVDLPVRRMVDRAHLPHENRDPTTRSSSHRHEPATPLPRGDSEHPGTVVTPVLIPREDRSSAAWCQLGAINWRAQTPAGRRPAPMVSRTTSPPQP